MHKHDEYAVKGWNPEDYPRSVLSGRTNEEVRADPEWMWRSDLPPSEASVPVRHPGSGALEGLATGPHHSASGPSRTCCPGHPRLVRYLTRSVTVQVGAPRCAIADPGHENGPGLTSFRAVSGSVGPTPNDRTSGRSRMRRMRDREHDGPGGRARSAGVRPRSAPGAAAAPRRLARSCPGRRPRPLPRILRRDRRRNLRIRLRPGDRLHALEIPDPAAGTRRQVIQEAYAAFQAGLHVALYCRPTSCSVLASWPRSCSPRATRPRPER
jgi:hypothetical protein